MIKKNGKPQYAKGDNHVVKAVTDISELQWAAISKIVETNDWITSIGVVYGFDLSNEKEYHKANSKAAKFRHHPIIGEEIRKLKNKKTDDVLTFLYNEKTKIIEDIEKIKEEARNAGDYRSALRAYEIINKMLGYFEPIKTETKTNIEISFGGWSPTDGFNPKEIPATEIKPKYLNNSIAPNQLPLSELDINSNNSNNETPEPDELENNK